MKYCIEHLYFFEIASQNNESFFLYVFLLSLGSCNAERETNLGSGYFLNGDKANSVISKLDKSNTNLSEDVILGEIEKFTFGNNFILVKRILSDKAKFYFEDHPLWKKQLGSEVQFWVIDKRYDHLYGPLDTTRYSKVRDNLNVSSKLNLF